MEWLKKFFKKDNCCKVVVEEVVKEEVVKEEEVEEIEVVEKISLSVTGSYHYVIKEYNNSDEVISYGYRHFDCVAVFNGLVVANIDGVSYSLKFDDQTIIVRSRYEEDLLNYFFSMSEEKRERIVMNGIKDQAVSVIRNEIKNNSLEDKRKMFKSLSEKTIEFTFEANKDNFEIK